MLSRIRKQVCATLALSGLALALSIAARPAAAEPARGPDVAGRIEQWIQWFGGMLAGWPELDLSAFLGKAGSSYEPGGLADPTETGAVDSSPGGVTPDSAGSSYDPGGRD